MNALFSMFQFFLSVLPALIVLGILVIVHEWGHFIAARLSGVRVEKFSIGFGPEVFHWQAKETRFSLSLLPLGGFVKLAGEEASQVSSEGPKVGDYLAAPVRSRMFIVTAGVIMNYILAFVILWMVFMIGRPMPGTVVGGFIEGYPAKESSLKVRDRILKVNDVAVPNWQTLLAELDKPSGDTIQLLVEREIPNSKPKTLNISLKPKVDKGKDIFGTPFEVRRIGIMPAPDVFIHEKYSPVDALGKAWETEVFYTVLNHKALFYLVTGRLSPKGLLGPLGIIQVTGQAAKAGIATLLQLVAVLSISLAVINLLPFPALDGGHLIFLLIEAVTRRRIDPVLQERITAAGFWVLILLMILVFWNDLVNLQVIDKIKNLLHLSSH